MSKSEYKRLNLTIPDVVKVIREQALDEAIEAVRSMKDDCRIYDSDYVVAVDEAIEVVEKLKNK